MSRVLGNIGVIRSAVKPDYTLLSADKIYYVDLDNGDDSTGTVGDPSKPYLTGQQAIDDADTSGDKALVLYVNFSGDYSATEDIELKGDVTVKVLHQIMLPKSRAGETFTQVSAWTHWLGNTDQYLDEFGGANRLYIGTITIGTTWAVGNEISGFNCDAITVKQDLATVTSGTLEDSSNQYRIFNIFCEGNITIDEASTLTCYGEWERVYAKGTCMYTSNAAGTIIGGYWIDCAAKGNAWNAETVTGRYHFCGLIGLGWGSGTDFIGYCYRCWASTVGSGVWGASSGDMMGTLEECYAGTDGVAENGGVSGRIHNCYLNKCTQLGQGVSGIVSFTTVADGYFILSGTLDTVNWPISGNTGKLTNTGYIYRSKINIDASRSIGNTGSAVYYCTGVIRDTDIIQAGTSTNVPIQAAQTTSGNPLIMDNVRIYTDNDYATKSGGAAAGTTQYMISNNVIYKSAVGYNDGLNFTVDEQNNLIAVTNNYRG